MFSGGVYISLVQWLGFQEFCAEIWLYLGCFWLVLEVFWCFFARSVPAEAMHVCLCVKYGALIVFLCLWPLEGLLIWLHNTFMGCQAARSLQKPQLISACCICIKIYMRRGCLRNYFDFKSNTVVCCMYVCVSVQWMMGLTAHQKSSMRGQAELRVSLQALWSVCSLIHSQVCHWMGVCVWKQNLWFLRHCFCFQGFKTFNTFSMFLVAMWIFILLKYLKVGQIIAQLFILIM